MAVTTTKTNKPINPRGNDQSPKGYNRAALYSGKALDFDGVNDEVSVGAEGGTYNDFTLVWNLKTSYNGAFQAIFSTGSVQDFYIDPSGQFRVFIGSSYDTTTLPAINSGEWVNLVLTRSGSTGSFYYNGVLVETLTISTTATNNTDVRIGANQYGSYPFNGDMAGFKLFNTALTAAQISDLYNNPEKIVPTGVEDTALKLWLPMMEGAGTTAYDGSGNGNHGTISGATYVNGVGAPVAQSAVIDWNKGTNFFSSSDWSVASATTNGTISSTTHLSPNGIDTAFIYNEGTGTTFNRGYKASNTGLAAGQITASTFVKKKDVDYINVVLGTDGGTYKFFALVDLVNGTINATSGSPTATSIQSVGNGWYYVSVEAPHLSTSQGITYIYGQDPTNGSSVDENYTGANNETYIWGINIQEGSINNVHLPTIGALQSSPVLLPQGLTSGRDITGVNLFENVRKQGALNLDGKSWAEVHNNASLDFGTGAFTLEAWAKVAHENTGSSVNAILGLGGNTTTAGTAYIETNAVPAIVFRYNTNFSVSSTLTIGDWVHIVATYDETNMKVYVNGVLEDTDAATAGNMTNTETKTIGRDDNLTRTYKDQIAQPRIYNRALTAEEVERNYNAGKNIYK